VGDLDLLYIPSKEQLVSAPMSRSTTILTILRLNIGLVYVRMHMQLYVTLQRLDIIPASQWFPTLDYFVPCSRSSPIPAPPPLEDFTPKSLLKWVGGFCINAAPMVFFWLWARVWTDLTTNIWQHLYARLPNTAHRRKELPAPAQAPNPESIPDMLEQINSNVADASLPPPLPPPAQPTAEPSLPSEPSRRPSAFSAGGYNYDTDDEEREAISATLISFDVEATESADAPPGLWSAELRPSLGPEARLQANQQPLYLDTMLTRLPAYLAADIFTVIVGYIVLAPLEATALRLVAKAFRRRAHLPDYDFLDANFFRGATWTGVTNLFGLEFVHLIIAGECWALVTGISQWFHMTEEEWKELQTAIASESEEERRIG
jgi:hypothetical protein